MFPNWKGENVNQDKLHMRTYFIKYAIILFFVGVS
jgi:hypothetical protein